MVKRVCYPGFQENDANNLTDITASKALIIAALDPALKDLRSAVSGIVFMATPHRGASLANTVTSLVHLVPGVQAQLLVDLETNCELLLNLSEGFRHQTIDIISFYETRMTNGVLVSVTGPGRERLNASTNSGLT